VTDRNFWNFGWLELKKNFKKLYKKKDKRKKDFKVGEEK
jgi:hypothetical protein